MRVEIQKWGNSLAVRIPKAIAVESKIQQGSEVDLTLEDGRVVLNPVQPPEYRLEDLLAEVSRENLHGEVDMGGPLGKESW
jgi:antitoxin MazE